MLDKPHSHLTAEGEFQSDKYPELAPDKIVLSFTDPRARRALAMLAISYLVEDPQLAHDILERLTALWQVTKTKRGVRVRRRRLTRRSRTKSGVSS